MKEKILRYYTNNPEAIKCYNLLEEAFKALGIYSDMVMIGAMATVRTEVGKSFNPVTENLNYSAEGLIKIFSKYFNSVSAFQYARQPEKIANKVYANRMDNGNETSGDGWKFKGRGLVQITGRYNYKKYGDALGIDLISNPDRANDIAIATKILALFFKENNCHILCNKQDWLGVRKKVNGVSAHGYHEVFLPTINLYLK